LGKPIVQMSKSEEHFKILNPLYNVVFKYLMTDEEVAKEVLEILTGYKILELHLDETELIPPENSEKVHLFHSDFKVTIEIVPQQTETVIISIQKANQMTDIFQFKQHIINSFQYKQERKNINPKTGEIENVNHPIKLIPILILNFEIEYEHQDLVIRNRPLNEAFFFEKSYQNDIFFTQHLAYEMQIIQLPYFKNIQPKHFENELFKQNLYTFLKLFTQSHYLPENRHKLLILRDEFSEIQFQPIIQRLQYALEEFPRFEQEMYLEDEALEEWQKHKNTIAFLQTQIEEKQNEINEKAELIENQNEQLEQQKEMLRQYARMLDQMGKNTEEIQQLTNLSVQEIEEL